MDICSLLIKAGANVDASNSYSWTPLIEATRANKCEIVEQGSTDWVHPFIKMIHKSEYTYAKVRRVAEFLACDMIFGKTV